MDRKWNSAAGMAYTAGLIGFIFGVFLVGSSCAAYSRAFFKLAGFSYIVAAILSLVTLIGIQSDICFIFTEEDYNVFDSATECTASTGAILAVIAGVCYLITAGICFFMPAAREENEKDKNETDEPATTTTGAKDEAVNENVQSAPEMDVESDDNNGNKDPVVDTAAPVDASSTSENESNAEAIENQIDQGFWTMLSDNILFLIGSVFFMWLAVLDLQWAKTVQGWVDLDIIDGEFDIRDNELQDLANYTWADDDYVFQTRFHWVSMYQIVYFIAGAAFLIEGFLDFFVTPGFRGLWFTFAGGTGLLAAWLSERDADLANIFSLISSFLFVVEAIGLVLYRSDFTGWLKYTILVNDCCFVIATTIDVVLGFTAVFKLYRMSIVRADTASASLWLFCSVVYVGLTLYAKRKGFFDKKEANIQAKEKSSASGVDEPDTPPEEQAMGSRESQ